MAEMEQRRSVSSGVPPPLAWTRMIAGWRGGGARARTAKDGADGAEVSCVDEAAASLA